jgi:hypothetical protein
MSARQKMKLIKELLRINPNLTVSQVGRRLNLAASYIECRSTPSLPKAS